VACAQWTWQVHPRECERKAAQQKWPLALPPRAKRAADFGNPEGRGCSRAPPGVWGRRPMSPTRGEPLCVGVWVALALPGSLSPSPFEPFQRTVVVLRRLSWKVMQQAAWVKWLS